LGASPVTGQGANSGSPAYQKSKFHDPPPPAKVQAQQSPPQQKSDFIKPPPVKLPW
jgi:hypothetical protein